jgi:hypothetical protein
MAWEIESGLDWTEHFVEYGFAVRRGLVDREFCDEALARVREIIDNDRPLQEWDSTNTETLHRPFYQGSTSPEPVLDRLMEQPRLRQAIAELFGDAGPWNEERNYYLFLKPYHEESRQQLSPRGHIDFTIQPAPALYRGFTFQLSLIDTEPFSGNLTVYPGTHKIVQKTLIEHPDAKFNSGMYDLPTPEPFEFVAEAGDVLFMHHLIFHSGNASHADNRTPRVALHGEAFRDKWLKSIDPSRPGLSPWERSLAFNGPYTAPPEVEQIQMKHRLDYLETLREKGAQAVKAY